MTETIRTVMALKGLYPDSISNSLRVQDVYGDSRSYCVRCGRTWTSHVTWIKLDLRSQRVLKNWKQPCLDCGQEVSPYITSEELERMVTIAVERCLELIEEQKRSSSSGSPPPPSPSSPKRRRSTANEKLRDGDQETSSPDAPASPSEGRGQMVNGGFESSSPYQKLGYQDVLPNDATAAFRQPQAFPAHRHGRPRPPIYPLSFQPLQANVSNQLAPQMPIYTTGLVPVHVYYDSTWSGSPSTAYGPTTPIAYVPAAAPTLSTEQQQPLLWSPPLPVCCP